MSVQRFAWRHNSGRPGAVSADAPSLVLSSAQFLALALGVIVVTRYLVLQGLQKHSENLMLQQHFQDPEGQPSRATPQALGFILIAVK